MAGQIIKRGENRWLVRVFTGWGPSTRKYRGEQITRNVKRYRNVTVYGTKEDAKAARAKLLNERYTETGIEPTRDTVAQYLDRWLKDAAAPKLREETLRQYREQLDHHIKPRIGGRVLSKLTPLEIQATYSAMTTRGLSASTVRYAHAVLRSALKQAVKWRMLSRNPAEAVDLPKRQREEMLVFTPEQAHTFISRAAGTREEAFYAVALSTGARPSEIFALRWTDLDVNTLRIVRKLTRRGASWKWEDVKRKRSRRAIDLDPATLAKLKDHKRLQAAERLSLGAKWNDLGLIFPDRVGEPERARTIVDRFKRLLTVPCVECPADRKACHACGGASRVRDLPNLRVYDLRHTAATLMLLAGISPKVVSERLGHASVAFTLDTYAHVLPTMQADAATRIGEMLFGTAKP